MHQDVHLQGNPVAGWLRSIRERIHLVAELAVAEVRLVALNAAAMCVLGITAVLHPENDS
jgi:hypothetical protein